MPSSAEGHFMLCASASISFACIEWESLDICHILENTFDSLGGCGELEKPGTKPETGHVL